MDWVGLSRTRVGLGCITIRVRIWVRFVLDCLGLGSGWGGLWLLVRLWLRLSELCWIEIRVGFG